MFLLSAWTLSPVLCKMQESHMTALLQSRHIIRDADPRQLAKRSVHVRRMMLKAPRLTLRM